MLKIVMTAQGIALLLYGFPYLVLPTLTQRLTGQHAIPESYFLRALGVTFVALGCIELRIVRDFEKHHELWIWFALPPSLFTATIVAQVATRGFNGAAWFWWANAVVSAAFALALFASGRSRRAVPAVT